MAANSALWRGRAGVREMRVRRRDSRGIRETSENRDVWRRTGIKEMRVRIRYGSEISEW